MRCLIICPDDAGHGWDDDCPMRTNHEIKWEPESWAEWVETKLGIKNDPLGNTCCTNCLFATQDTRFHDEHSRKCLFPMVVPRVAFLVLFNGKIRVLMQERLRVAWGNSTDVCEWMLKPAFQDQRWLNCATWLVQAAFK